MPTNRPRRLAHLPIFTILGAALATGALIAITAMAARAAAPPNLAKALDIQKQLTAARPNDAAAWNDLGNLLVLARQSNDAVAAYRRSIEIDSHRTSALFNLGLLLQQQGNYKDAKQLYDKVIEIEPNHAWAHYQLGTLHERKTEKARAIREYAQAFALDPQLAFREVNPQVVESGLVTESLLRAYERRSSGGEASVIYDQPSRIRDLLLQPKEADKTAEGNDPKQPPAVLRPKDLPTGNVGQATPLGGAKANPAAPVRPAMPGTPYTGAGVPGSFGAPGSRQWSRPSPNNPSGATDPMNPGVVVTPPPNGLYYRPSVPSTGRLDSQLVPQENAA